MRGIAAAKAARILTVKFPGYLRDRKPHNRSSTARITGQVAVAGMLACRRLVVQNAAVNEARGVS
jgi:hypothetical protein